MREHKKRGQVRATVVDLTPRHLARITLSTEGICAAARDCFHKAGTKANRQKWIDEHDLFVSEDGRAFALVDTEREVYFMDAITGTLYSLGQCHTSDHGVRTRFVRDREKASDVLMSVEQDDGYGYGRGHGRDEGLEGGAE